MKRQLSPLPARRRGLPALLSSAGLAALLCVVLLTAPAAGSVESEVQAAAADKSLAKGSVGVQVMRLGTKPADMTEVFARESLTPLIPASNLKLVTTAAALERLGPDFKFRTALVMRDQDLALIGDGDPSFGDAELLKKVGWKTTTVFENWAGVLKGQGIASVHNVLVDDSVFDEDFFHPRWPGKQWDARYEAQVGGVNLNANCVDIVLGGAGSPGQKAGYVLDPPTRYLSIQNSCTTGNGRQPGVGRQVGGNQVTFSGGIATGKRVNAWATLHDPPMFAATVLAETLGDAGIKVNGAVRRDRAVRQQQLKGGDGAGRWKVLAVHETPLPVVLGRANKDSINLYAESLCKRIGFEAARSGAAPTTGPSSAATGTWQNGTAAVADFLHRIGVPDGDFRLDDGSGLSRHNGVSPRTLVRVLAHEYYHRNREVYLASLSVAGVDGTLQDRFDNSDLRERVFGKSGYIDGVSTLSGYLHARDGNWYAFSIMMNGFKGSNRDMKLLQERIVKAIDATPAPKT